VDCRVLEHKNDAAGIGVWAKCCTEIVQELHKGGVELSKKVQLENTLVQKSHY